MTLLGLCRINGSPDRASPEESKMLPAAMDNYQIH